MRVYLQIIPAYAEYAQRVKGKPSSKLARKMTKNALRFYIKKMRRNDNKGKATQKRVTFPY